MVEVLAGVAIAIFGGGGLVSLVKVIIDWRNGVNSKREDREEKFTARLEARLEKLEREAEQNARYQARLIRVLIDAGLPIPERDEDEKGE